MPYSVGKLISGRGVPVTVCPDESVQSAVDKMIEHDYSQLPVIDKDGRPTGMVTSDSILRALECLKWRSEPSDCRLEPILLQRLQVPPRYAQSPLGRALSPLAVVPAHEQRVMHKPLGGRY